MEHVYEYLGAMDELGECAEGLIPGATMEHKLYETGDRGAPASILDWNGEVVLSLCKVCGGAEGDMPTE